MNSFVIYYSHHFASTSAHPWERKILTLFSLKTWNWIILSHIWVTQENVWWCRCTRWLPFLRINGHVSNYTRNTARNQIDSRVKKDEQMNVKKTQAKVTLVFRLRKGMIRDFGLLRAKSIIRMQKPPMWTWRYPFDQYIHVHDRK